MSAFNLNSLTTYASKWNETGRELLSEADPVGFKSIESAEVTEKEQDWGISRAICLMMVGGGQKYIPLSRDSELETGDKVDVNSIEIITLERDGDNPIYRGDGAVAVEKKPRGRR